MKKLICSCKYPQFYKLLGGTVITNFDNMTFGTQNIFRSDVNDLIPTLDFSSNTLEIEGGS